MDPARFARPSLSEGAQAVEMGSSGKGKASGSGASGISIAGDYLASKHGPRGFRETEFVGGAQGAESPPDLAPFATVF